MALFNFLVDHEFKTRGLSVWESRLFGRWSDLMAVCAKKKKVNTPSPAQQLNRKDGAPIFIVSAPGKVVMFSFRLSP